MAVSFAERVASSGAASTSVVLSTSGMTVSSGDLLVAFFATAATTTDAVSAKPSSDWTDALSTVSADGEMLFVSWKVAGAGEPSSYTWTMTESRAYHGVVARYTGADTTTPVHKSAITNTVPDLVHPTGTIVPTVDNCLIVAYWMVGSGSAIWTLDASLTSRYNASLQSLPSCLGDVLQVSHASVSKTSNTSNGQTSGNVILAIQPAAAAGGSTGVHITATLGMRRPVVYT